MGERNNQPSDSVDAAGSTVGPGVSAAGAGTAVLPTPAPASASGTTGPNVSPQKQPPTNGSPAPNSATGGAPSTTPSTTDLAADGEEKETVVVEPDAPDNERADGQAGPLEHKRPKGASMSDPNDRCVACGWEIDHDATQCDHCGYDWQSWNKVIDQYQQDGLNKGWSDKQIQDNFDDTLGQWRAQGLNHQFLQDLENHQVDHAFDR